MKIFKALVCIVCLIGVTNVMAKNITLHPEGLLTLEISEFAPNRLFLEHSKITEVFFYPEEAAKVILHKSGAVFVVPLDGKRHVYLTLISEDGTTQDLRLNFVKKTPEPVKFQEQVKATPVQSVQQSTRSKKS